MKNNSIHTYKHVMYLYRIHIIKIVQFGSPPKKKLGYDRTMHLFFYIKFVVLIITIVMFRYKLCKFYSDFLSYEKKVVLL